jgi:hypothetical protein
MLTRDDRSGPDAITCNIISKKNDVRRDRTRVRQGTCVNVAFYRPQVRCISKATSGKFSEEASKPHVPPGSAVTGIPSISTTGSFKSISGLESYINYNKFLMKTNGPAIDGSQSLTFVRRWNNVGPCMPQRG